jgi:hypothetical protein
MLLLIGIAFLDWNKISPFACSSLHGVVVPIPTYPAELKFKEDVAHVKNCIPL